MNKRLNRNQVAQISSERAISKASPKESQRSNRNPDHLTNKPSRYSALYTKTKNNSFAQFQDPEVDPQEDGSRQLHNNESNISMFTMAENLEKLKKGRAFTNGNPIKGQLVIHDANKNKQTVGIVKDYDTIPQIK